MASTQKLPVARVDGLPKLLRVLRDLPKEASADLRDRAQRIADRQAQVLRDAAMAHSDRRVQLLASTIRSRRDRLPVIAVGGAKRLPISGQARAGDVMYGTEFGAMPDGPNGWRFPDPTGKTGYWLFPTLRDHHDQVVAEWTDAYQDVLRRWAGS